MDIGRAKQMAELWRDVLDDKSIISVSDVNYRTGILCFHCSDQKKVADLGECTIKVRQENFRIAYNEDNLEIFSICNYDTIDDVAHALSEEDVKKLRAVAELRKAIDEDM